MSLSLEPKTTALIVVDLQNMTVGRPLTPHSGGEVLERTARLAGALRQAGGVVAYVRVDPIEFMPRTVDEPMPFDPKALPKAAMELAPGCGYTDGDLLIVKRSWGAFYGTSLDQLLRQRRIRTVIMAGIATHIGVESTARSAFDRCYELVFASDAMSAMSEETHGFALKHIFPRMGQIRQTDDIIQALRA